MARLISLEDVQFASSPSSANEVLQRGKKLCSELEEGNILFFPNIPFTFPKEDVEFLLRQKQSEGGNRKNISYKPVVDKLHNFKASSKEQAECFHRIMKQLSEEMTLFLAKLLTPYGSKWKLDYMSFRPLQEKGRKLRTRARNDLLHVDSFPSRPVHGMRILRFFVNINPKENRKWITSEDFSTLVKRYGGSKNLPFPKGLSLEKKGSLVERLYSFLRGGKKERSPYDHFMLEMHNFLKENEKFQKESPKDHWEFPPNSCWMVFTDQVTHAALSGQYALEQTFLIPESAMVSPEKAPVRILEELTKKIMVSRSS